MIMMMMMTMMMTTTVAMTTMMVTIAMVVWVLYRIEQERIAVVIVIMVGVIHQTTKKIRLQKYHRHRRQDVNNEQTEERVEINKIKNVALVVHLLVVVVVVVVVVDVVVDVVVRGRFTIQHQYQ